jgi:pyruvate-ferredoxin/flavodoxin oxidoreductase
MTVSHLRFGPDPIRSPYLVTKANFIACHQTIFLEKYDMLNNIQDGGVFLVNTPWTKEELWDNLPKTVQKHIIEKKVKLYTIDAQKVAEGSGMGRRINTVMQVCFFAISGVLPREEAIKAIKDSIVKTYGKKGEEIVNMNLKAVDNTLANLFEVTYPNQITAKYDIANPVPDEAPEFVKNVLSKLLPVAAMNSVSLSR